MNITASIFISIMVFLPFITSCTSSISVRKSEEEIILKNDKNIDENNKTEKDTTITAEEKNKRKKEEKDFSFSVAGRTNYAINLAEKYMEIASESQKGEDVAAFGIIAAAAVGAGGILYGADSDVLKGAGLAAGTLTAGRGYVRPAEAAEALMDAADGLICIATIGRSLTESSTDTNLINDGIVRVKINLHKRLLRKAPDFRSLLQEYKNNVENAARLTEAQKTTSTMISECVVGSISRN